MIEKIVTPFIRTLVSGFLISQERPFCYEA